MEHNPMLVTNKIDKVFYICSIENSLKWKI